MLKDLDTLENSALTLRGKGFFNLLMLLLVIISSPPVVCGYEQEHKFSTIYEATEGHQSLNENTSDNIKDGASKNKSRNLNLSIGLNVDNSVEEEDPSTLLDAFGEMAKDILTHHIIPPTHSRCRWDWRYFRCEPYCICKFQVHMGDYHLGRSCRLRSPYQHQQQIDNEGADYGTDNISPDECHLPPDSLYSKAFASSRMAIKLGREKLQELELQMTKATSNYQTEIYDKICYEHNSGYPFSDSTDGSDNDATSDLSSKIGRMIPAIARRIQKTICTILPHGTKDLFTA